MKERLKKKEKSNERENKKRERYLMKEILKERERYLMKERDNS